MKLLVLNGPNINMLGIREPGIYGKNTFSDLLALIEKTASELNIEIEQFQSNHEGVLVDKIQAAYGNVASWTIDDILDERGREFTWEMVRRRDLIRYNKFNDIQYVTDAKAKEAVRKWFPIPFSVLEKSLIDDNGQKVWTQTPGYENL